MANLNFDEIKIDSPITISSSISSDLSFSRGAFPKFSNSVEIFIKDFERRSSHKSFSIHDDTSIIYLVDTSVINVDYKTIPSNSQVWRNEEEFDQFRNYLENIYPYAIIPPMTERKMKFSLRNLGHDVPDYTVLMKRKILYEDFLKRVKAHPVLSEDDQFWKFLTDETTWVNPQNDFISAIKKAEKALLGWSLKAPSKERRIPNMEFVDLLNYGNETAKILANLEKHSEKMESKELDMMQGFAHLSEMIRALAKTEPTIEEWFLKAAGFTENLETSNDDQEYNDKSHLRAVLKLYQLYAESLKVICKNQDVIQASMERSETDLFDKFRDRELLSQHRSTVPKSFSKIFGTSEQSLESKSMKAELDVRDSEMMNKMIREEHENFLHLATVDIVRFKREKNNELKAALVQEVEYQIRKNRRNASLWSSINKCYEAI